MTKHHYSPTNRKRSLDEIRPFFEEHGYVLLSTQYIDNQTKLNTRCPNGHLYEVRWNSFLQGRRCRQGVCDKRRLTIEEVRVVFKTRGYTLLSTSYMNAHTLLSTLCPNGHKYCVSWANFRSPRHKGCRQCSYEKSRSSAIEVIEAIEDVGYQLLSAYKNCKTKLKIQCDQSHEYETTWDIFKAGCRCPICNNGKWVREAKLGKILRDLFPNSDIKFQDNLGFLGLQRVDYFVPSMKMAFEYDGAQHFQPVRFGGCSQQTAEKNFRLIQKRDQRKDILCSENGITLIRISHKEPLTKEHVAQQIQEADRD